MPTLAIQSVTDQQLSRFGELIYDRTGIRISPQKKSLLSNRLRRRLKATGIECFDEYLRLLKKLRADDAEWDAFLQEVTTHESYLFRDEGQWQWFMDCYLTDIQQEARQGKRSKSLRIWSAASSTGDEAYTIACCIAHKLVDPAQWRIEIIGTDIGVDAIEHARQAKYGEKAMRKVPEGFRRRFFTSKEPGTWVVKRELTKWAKFQQHNLMDPFRSRPFDLVFVKNVLIYFDKVSKVRVMENIDQMIKPGGILVNGPAEGIAELVRSYERCEPWRHRKPV